METSRCRSCGAEIIWTTTANRRSMPMDARPVQVYRLQDDIEGRTVAEHVGGKLYQSHFATCPNAAKHRKRDHRESDR